MKWNVWLCRIVRSDCQTREPSTWQPLHTYHRIEAIDHNKQSPREKESTGPQLQDRVEELKLQLQEAHKRSTLSGSLSSVLAWWRGLNLPWWRSSGKCRKNKEIIGLMWQQEIMLCKTMSKQIQGASIHFLHSPRIFSNHQRLTQAMMSSLRIRRISYPPVKSSYSYLSALWWFLLSYFCAVRALHIFKSGGWIGLISLLGWCFGALCLFLLFCVLFIFCFAAA